MITPTPFLWGAATAGHQVEGNNVNADIWLLEQVQGTLFAEPSGDACNSLAHWREDVALIESLGLNCYRFSVEWSRIEPAQRQFSIAWLDHYARIAAHCRDRHIAPVVTLSHFTSPRWFAAAGGWENGDAPALFARFADRVARRIAGEASHVVTFNEPNLQKLGTWSTTPLSADMRDGFATMMAAAAKASGSDRFSVLVYPGDTDAQIALVAAGHAQARAALKAVRGDLPVGLSLAVPDAQATGPENALAAFRKSVDAPFFAMVKDDDFIGIQTYSRLLIGPKGSLPPAPGMELTEAGDEFYPEALGNAVRYVHAATGKPIFVTENGIGAADDAQRRRFLPAALASLDAVRRDGVPVIGYIHWSLMDNFEWRRGYSKHFGLVAVDRRTFRRTPKPSARLYAKLVEARA
ncbi:family 1 glycosylhydrolase [Sphingomonas sp. So64.6b]|uniref:glycoside hydrolase family 1 protein n=1 Tax=Sphingomonas sp. So64.6b TaxID=2997354 RepID=UPI0016014609|nr:family 1 glycosylhydrolase [Sphingomonas sp. So64.6b]